MQVPYGSRRRFDENGEPIDAKTPEQEILATGRCSNCNCKNGWSDCNRITDRTTDAYHSIRWRENQQ